MYFIIARGIAETEEEGSELPNPKVCGQSTGTFIFTYHALCQDYATRCTAHFLAKDLARPRQLIGKCRRTHASWLDFAVCADVFTDLCAETMIGFSGVSKALTSDSNMGIPGLWEVSRLDQTIAYSI